jgi:hypothetical protein
MDDLTTLRTETHVAPDVFTAGTYQGLTDQAVMSRMPGSFITMLVPRGSSKPEWLTRWENPSRNGVAEAMNDNEVSHERDASGQSV